MPPIRCICISVRSLLLLLSWRHLFVQYFLYIVLFFCDRQVTESFIWSILITSATSIWRPTGFYTFSNVFCSIHATTGWNNQTSWPGLPLLCQWYTVFFAPVSENPITTLNGCLTELQEWMSASWLRLHPDKTEVLMMGHRTRLQHSQPTGLTLGGSELQKTEHVRNLDVVLDSGLTIKH